MSADRILVVPYDEAWPLLFRELGRRLRDALGGTAIRIDHTGSTSIPGLAAKPIVDVQVSVASLEPVDLYRADIERCGFRFRPDNPDLTKRYFRELPGERRTHIHVRRHGSTSERLALLFRDYLRAHDDRAVQYAALKLELADRFATDRLAYTDAKSPFIMETVALAEEWALATGWTPGPGDA